MSTDVPIRRPGLDEEVWDEARVRQIEVGFAGDTTGAQAHRGGPSTIGSGRLVAFTEIAVPPVAPESVWQHDTLVMRGAPRARPGLRHESGKPGRAGSASVREVRAITHVECGRRTRPMIAVNDMMGFEVVAEGTVWLKDLDPWRTDRAQESRKRNTARTRR